VIKERLPSFLKQTESSPIYLTKMAADGDWLSRFNTAPAPPASVRETDKQTELLYQHRGVQRKWGNSCTACLLLRCVFWCVLKRGELQMQRVYLNVVEMRSTANCAASSPRTHQSTVASEDGCCTCSAPDAFSRPSTSVLSLSPT